MATLLRRILPAVALAALAAGVYWAWQASRLRRAPRVIFLSPAVEGLDADWASGVGRLWMDQMEVASGATVLAQRGLPSPEVVRSLAPGSLLMRLSGRRQGDDLGLRLEWIRASDLSRGAAWRSAEVPPAPPSEAFRLLRRAGPLPLLLGGADHLLPRDPGRFWALAASVSVQDDAEALKDMDLSWSLARAEPEAAAVWLNLGEHLYRSLWVQPAGGSLPQAQALEAFDRAMALVHGYPRAALLKGMLLTDVGDQRQALRVLVEARSLRPGIPDLYSGLAYAGRTSGLLEGAERAVAARERLIQPLDLPSPWFAENTYLYAGEWAAFRQSLRGRKDPVFLFYEGYLDMAEGRRGDALEAFRAGAALKRTSMPFSDLCGVYAMALEGRKDEALAALGAFEEARGKLRVPDGELTFKVAEAYAYLGRPEDANEVAGRAFAQGFACLAWYDRSPFFAPARQSPRWKALRQHLQERQELLARSFPPSMFG